MAEMTTTKQAAVWKPPRLMKLALGGTKSGSIDGPSSWERQCSSSNQNLARSAYRMPNSGERTC